MTLEPMNLRPLLTSGAPSPSIVGYSWQCGSALATEVDTYRRRIQTLLHFFDCIAQHWWDQLYPYKKRFIKRPSRSADEVRSYHSRLMARLNRFTMRNVVPATAAIAMMEAHANVKVLPQNLLNQMTAEFAAAEIPSAIENSENLLRKACILARRLGDIEKLKQRLILSALTWITSDGRDFNLRAQRVALLVRHAEPCLIEHYDGVRALLTHYYRPRVRSGTPGSSDQTTPRTEPITAARLTTTNEQIVQAVRSVCARFHQHWPIEPAVAVSDPFTVQLSPTSRLGFWNEATEDSLGEEKVNGETLTNLNLFSYDTMNMQVQGRAPILPSIVLNPLSIDTSQLDWLSYEINQRDLNLHVLNMEEPEGIAVDEEFTHKFPSSRRASIINAETPIRLTQMRTSFSKDPLTQSALKVSSHSKWGGVTPIASPVMNRTDWSSDSNDLDSSEADEMEPHRAEISQVQMTKVPTAESASVAADQLETLDPTSTKPQLLESMSHKTEDSSSSLLDIRIRPRTLVSPGGAGEGPLENLLTIVSPVPKSMDRSSDSIKSKTDKNFTAKSKLHSTSRNVNKELRNQMIFADGTNTMNMPRRNRRD